METCAYKTKSPFQKALTIVTGEFFAETIEKAPIKQLHCLSAPPSFDFHHFNNTENYNAKK